MGIACMISTQGLHGKFQDVIAAPESEYTVWYLRHHAKIYIRSPQQNLRLEAMKEEVRVCNIHT